VSCLHTVSKSPDRELLQQCLAVASAGDTILFIEDGVYHCLLEPGAMPVRSDVRMLALEQDVLARGLGGHNLAQLAMASYDDFVDLCCNHDKTLSWF